MRTLYLHGSPDFYGAGRVLLDILQIPGNAQKAIVVFPHEGPLCNPIKELGIPVLIVNMGVLRKKYFTPHGVIGRIALWIIAIIRLRKLIKKEKIDSVYVNSLSVIIGPWLKTNTSIKLIWHLHEIIEEPFALRFFLTAQLKKADQILAVSKAAQRHWQHLLPDQPVDLLYNGIDVEVPTSWNTNKKWNRKRQKKSDIVIGMIGRIQERKGQSYLLRIAEHILLHTETGNALHFSILIAGDAYPGYEHLTEHLIDEIKLRGLESHVSYIGYQEDIPGLLTEVDLVIVPSTLPDSFPTVVLEAMKFSLPVIATRQGGCLEMIEEGITGFFIPLNDVETSANILAALLLQKPRLQEAGKKGRERVAALFSLAAFRENWLRLVQG